MDNKLNTWLTQNAMNLLRISIGVIYVWFGALKFYPNLSPADQLAKDTIYLITFGDTQSRIDHFIRLLGNPAGICTDHWYVETCHVLYPAASHGLYLCAAVLLYGYFIH